VVLVGHRYLLVQVLRACNSESDAATPPRP
jgi:hypothetical protein